jgi:pyridoxine/pyridoxamine 5'-phosphate oxidase
MSNKEDKQFKLMELIEKDLIKDPFKQFEIWYAEAKNSNFPYPNSFVLIAMVLNFIQTKIVAKEKI